MTTKTATPEIRLSPTTVSKPLRRDAILTAVRILLGILVVGVLVVQTFSLFIVPIFDSYRWWGDESWFMLEFQQQILTGIFHHPYALGATIHHSNGLLFGSMWITAALYGISASIFSNNIVAAGRIVTFVLSLVLLALLFQRLRKRATIEIALASILVLVSSRFYLWTSHSARYDMITGLAVTVILIWSAETLRSKKDGLRAFTLGLLFGVSLLVTVHVAFLLVLPGLYVSWRRGRTSRWSSSWLVAGGAVVPFILCVFIQWMTVGSISLFGSSGSGGFTSNAMHIPAMHFYSRNVWMNSLLQKWQSCWEMGWWLPFALLVAIAGDIWKIVRQRTIAAITVQRRLLWLSVVGYFAFEGPQFFYLIFIAPVIVLLFAETLKDVLSERPFVSTIVMGLAGIAICSMGVSDAMQARTVRSTLVANLESSNYQLRRFLDSTARVNGRERVLLAAPSVNEAVAWRSIEPVTTQFIDFPELPGTLPQQLDRLHVTYIEVFASGLTPFYIPEQFDLRRAAEQRGKPVLSISGAMIDPARNYFHPLDLRPDTLLLYQWQQK